MAVLSTMPTAVRAEDVTEKFPDGTTKARYTTDAEGRKVGAFLEYYPDGKVHIKATYVRGELNGDYTEHHPSGKVKIKSEYKAGKLSGAYASFHDNGKPAIKAVYADGLRNGPYAEWAADGRVAAEQIYWQDRLLYARSTRMLKEALEGILGPGALGGARPVKTTKPTPEAAAEAPWKSSLNVNATQRLNAYRYLVGVAYDVTLSEKYCDLAQAAADICAKIGELNHTPKNPGMPEAEYKKAYEGTTHANLHAGLGTRGSVDSYMDDSDPTNIDRVGHRRWCLNPTMKECGFGENGTYSAMYAHDRSRQNAPDYDHVAYPAAGFMPNRFFQSSYAWHVSVNPAKYKKPEKSAIKVTVWPLAAAKGQMPSPDKRDAALAMDYFNVDYGGYGIPNAIIFRPKGVSTRDGSAYWVEITGLQKSDGSAAKLEYVVHFVDL
jgi:hypothetical protein